MRIAWLAFLLAGCERPQTALTATPTPESPTPVAVATAAVARMTPPARAPRLADPFHVGTPTPEAAAPLQAQGGVTNPVFSLDEGGLQATQEFPADTQEIFLSFDLEAPRKPGTLKSVWQAGDHRSAESLTLRPGPQHLTVSGLRPPSGWPVGPAQVELQLGAKPLATFEFTVTTASTPLPMPAPPAPSDARVPSIILTDQEEGTELKQTFPAGTGTLYVKVANGQLPGGIPVDAVWKAVQVRGLSAGQVIKQSRSPATGNAEDVLQFGVLAPTGGSLLAGEYSVDVAVGRETIWTCPFRVR